VTPPPIVQIGFSFYRFLFVTRAIHQLECLKFCGDVEVGGFSGFILIFARRGPPGVLAVDSERTKLCSGFFWHDGVDIPVEKKDMLFLSEGLLHEVVNEMVFVLPTPNMISPEHRHEHRYAFLNIVLDSLCGNFVVKISSGF